MSLKDKGFRFCISPCRLRSRWLNPTEQAALYAGWRDVTDWDEGELLSYLENGEAA